jgi:hypothetical protein
MPRRLGTACCAAAALLITACAVPGQHRDDPQPRPSSPSPSTTSSSSSDLMALINRLPVRAERPDGYAREKFHLWTDADHDGCDTRHEVLLAEATTKPRQGENCKLTGGSWTSYYDGKTVTRDSALDIDHMVPLKDAWSSGASQWSATKRERYANDLDADRSLVAVTLRVNRQKSDRDPSEWMPPAAAAHCQYAEDWITTKIHWKLSSDLAERAALRKLARVCT